MRLIIPTLLCIFSFQTSQSQVKVSSFTDAIKSNIKKYNAQTDKEFEKGDVEKGNALFDSLVQNHLVGTHFEDYTLKSVNSRKVKLSSINKPVFIITYASWCIMNKGEIPAINKLARKYEDDIQFIVVFWDKKSDAKKMAHQFSNQIKVCYANESYRNDESVVATLKHSLGFPTSFFLNEELEVVDIKRGGVPIPPRTAFKKAFDMNFAVFDERMISFLNKKDTYQEQQLASTSD
jgi:thiol-disulfide isomerase/thioredoxin